MHFGCDDSILTFSLQPMEVVDVELKQKVESALSKIRPALVADGGNVELVDIVGNVARVKLTGRCGGCPMSQMTLKMGVEKIVKNDVPEIDRVDAV